MTKIAKATPPAKSSNVTIVDSEDPDKIRDGMAKSVDGWADMSADVQRQIVSLNVEVNARRCAPVLDVIGNGGNTQISPSAENPQLHTLRLMRTLATMSPEFLNYVVSSLSQFLNSKDGLTAGSLNAALALIDGIGPKNEAETLLAMQMFMTNDAALRALKVMNNSGHADSMEKFGNLSVKLMRTFTAQAEAMAKLQRGGVQRVEHYYIDNRGGQAVIGENVTTGGQFQKIEGQSHATGNSGVVSAMSCADAVGRVVPIASRQGAQALPDARRD